MNGRTRSLLFTPRATGHTVNLVVISGGGAFRERMGSVLRELRKNTVGDRGRPLTQQEAADQIGTDADTVGRWERGQNLPGVELLGRIADAYGLPKAQRWILLDPPPLPKRVSPLEELLKAQPLNPEEEAQLEGSLQDAMDQIPDEVFEPPTRPSAGGGTRRRQAS